MSTWRVFKYVTEDGKCPIDKWLESRSLTDKDRAKLEAKISKLETTAVIPPDTVKKYKTTDLYELKVRGDNKQLRPLCIKDNDKKIILLCGVIKKGQISKNDLSKAEKIKTNYERGKGYAHPYYEDEEDLE